MAEAVPSNTENSDPHYSIDIDVIVKDFLTQKSVGRPQCVWHIAVNHRSEFISALWEK